MARNLLGLLPRIPVANRYVVSDASSPNNADHIYQALVLAAPAGVFYEEHRTEAVEVFDFLVEAWAAVEVEVENGRGYQLSREAAAAFGISAVLKNAKEAALN